MDLSKLLLPGAVRVVGQFTSKKRLFQELAETAAQVHGVQAALALDGLQERETLGPTGVGHGDTTDVEAVVVLGRVVDGRVEVDPTEHERQVAELEVLEAGLDPIVDDVALVAVLEGPAGTPLDGLPHGLDRPLGLLQAVVRVVDVGLLSFQLGMVRHTCSCRGPDPQTGNQPV